MKVLLYKLAGAAGLLASGILFLEAAGLVQARLHLGALGAGCPPHNWLLILLQWNAGFSGVGFDVLKGLNPLDLVLLFLVGFLCIGLYMALKSTSRIWSLIALAQPFLGILIVCVTQLAGRSALMGAILVISAVMLRSGRFSKPVALVGLVAAVLLLVGDVGTTPGSHSLLLAFSLGAGYLLLILWLALVGTRLFQLARKELS